MSEHQAGLEIFDDVERIIVVAAHPDDLECLCGGTISMLTARGKEIISVNCTLGDIGTQDAQTVRPALASTRLNETDVAARMLGLRGTHNLGHHDGELVPDLELRAQIARLYRITQADTLMTFDPFWTGQIHPDHRSAGQAALDASMPSRMPLYRPEQLREEGADVGQIKRVLLFGTNREPDVYIDVTDVYATKLAACMAHVSQFPYGEESLQWMKDRDAHGGEVLGVAYAEVFKRMLTW